VETASLIRRPDPSRLKAAASRATTRSVRATRAITPTARSISSVMKRS
jgi:hypothetical protein